MPTQVRWTLSLTRLSPIIGLAALALGEAPCVCSLLAMHDALPERLQTLADKTFELLTVDPRHPSPHSKHVGRFRSVRVGLHYRALGVDIDDGVLWFWIGTHAEYDSLVS